MDKELLYAYLAGFVDADGSIGIVSVSKPKSYVVKLSAHNCKEDPIILFQSEFGGKVRCKKTGKAKLHDNWRPCYEWIVTANLASNAIEKLLPYLRSKRVQALTCLRLNKIKHWHSASQKRWDRDLSEKCTRIYQKLKDRTKKLNRRGLHVENKQESG